MIERTTTCWIDLETGNCRTFTFAAIALTAPIVQSAASATGAPTAQNYGLADASESPMRITGPATLPQDEQLTVYVTRDGRRLFVHALARSDDKDVFLAELNRKHVDTAPLQMFLHNIL